VADVPSDLSFTPPQETKKKKRQPKRDFRNVACFFVSVWIHECNAYRYLECFFSRSKQPFSISPSPCLALASHSRPQTLHLGASSYYFMYVTLPERARTLASGRALLEAASEKGGSLYVPHSLVLSSLDRM
jgi:hypothetical protein